MAKYSYICCKYYGIVVQVGHYCQINVFYIIYQYIMGKKQIEPCYNCGKSYNQVKLAVCPSCDRETPSHHVFNPAEDVMYIGGRKVYFHTHPDCPVTDCHSDKGENGCICDIVL